MLTNLTLLGKSDSTIAVLLDNLESCELFPEITIVNNMDLPIEHPFEHPRFSCTIVKHLPEKNDFVALGVSNIQPKIKIVESFGAEDLNFINIIHKSAIVSCTAKLGRGVVINNLAGVGPYAEIGNFVKIANRACVNHHCVIEDFVSVNPGAMVTGHVYIGRGTLIGAGAVISNGLSIGKNSIIGAGSVVVRDIPDNVVAYGNPCKPMRANG